MGNRASPARANAAFIRELLEKRNEALAAVGAEDSRRNRIERKARKLGVPLNKLPDFSEDTERGLDLRLKNRSEQAETR